MDQTAKRDYRNLVRVPARSALNNHLAKPRAKLHIPAAALKAAKRGRGQKEIRQDAGAEGHEQKNT